MVKENQIHPRKDPCPDDKNPTICAKTHLYNLTQFKGTTLKAREGVCDHLLAPIFDEIDTRKQTKLNSTQFLTNHTI